MKKILTSIALTLFLAACSSTNVIDDDKADYEQWRLSQHTEKAAAIRGQFCNGEGYKWYYEGKYAISGTCENGMVFHLPLRE